MKSIKEFAKQSHINESIIRAVVRQIGGWEYFQQTAPDVSSYGAAGGFSGFTMYTDTEAFFHRNRADIISMSKEMADQLGEGVLEMVQSFGCLGKDYTLDEIGVTLYGTKRNSQTQIANALAWFALEEVCRSYVDILEA
jgi:hypothetical protein